MTVQDAPAVSSDVVAEMVRLYLVEKFYRDEAALLDAHNYPDWLELFTEDTRYFMPLRRTMTRRELDKEFTKPGEMAFFDDTKDHLRARARKFDSGTAWAEDPPSRTRHLISNVRVLDDDTIEMTVESYFHLYRTRLKSVEDSWIGRRLDVLRRTEAGLQIAKRTVYLDQTLLLSGNLSNFM